MTQRKLVLGVSALGVAGLVMLTSACGLSTVDSYTDDNAIGETIRSVRLASDAGSIKIHTGGPTKVHRTVKHHGDRPGATHRVEGDVLVLTGCEVRNCWIDYDVVVPAGATVTGQVESGDVTVDDAASVNVRSEAGNVVIRRAGGPVNIAAESGAVELTEIGDTVSVEVESGDVKLDRVDGSATVRAQSGKVAAMDVGGATDIEVTSGDVDVRLTEAADVKARTESGDVQVIVPLGRYKVTASTDSGDVENAVTADSAGAHSIDLSATSGDVTVRYA